MINSSVVNYYDCIVPWNKKSSFFKELLVMGDPEKLEMIGSCDKYLWIACSVSMTAANAE
jgi:hypothetical protein